MPKNALPTPIQAYLDHVGRTLPRLEAVSQLLAGEPRTWYAIEGAALQLRMVLEAVALGSLAANREAYERVRATFAKDWHAGKILEVLDGINPQFYPAPQVAGTDDDPRIKVVLTGRQDGYLTRADFPHAYGRLGGLLHLRNPFAAQRDPAKVAAELVALRESVWMLLDWHTIRVVDDDTLYLVWMRDPSGSPKAAVLGSPYTKDEFEALAGPK